MAKAQQLRQIFEPVLKTNPDLVLLGRRLFKPPIHNAIVGIVVMAMDNPKSPRFALSVLPLSRPTTPVRRGFDRAFEMERVIGLPPPMRAVSSSAPSRLLNDMFAPNFADSLIENFDAKARPFLDHHQSLQSIIDWVSAPGPNPIGWPAPEPTAGWCAIMAGDFARAAAILMTFVQRMEEAYRTYPVYRGRSLPAEIPLCRNLAETLATQDPARIAAHLHAMEAATIAHHKLQKHWQPTPFPFE